MSAAPAPVTRTSDRSPITAGLTLGEANVAHEPPEARGVARDQVRLLVSRGDDEPQHARFTDLPALLREGDLLVVNRSATVPAAIDGWLGGERVVVHFSNEMPGGLWLVEVRAPLPGGSSAPLSLDAPGRVELVGGGVVDLLVPYAGSRRLWFASTDVRDVLAHLRRHGRAIRYSYVWRDWPIDAYQTVFGVEPGSAEMPSAARPFSPDVVVDLVRRGITIAPVVLHTGVSSLEGHEAPYPERYRVPASTATLVNATHGDGGRVIAVGTTVVRALETSTDEHGVMHPSDGWTELVVSPANPPRAVDGLVTGWHEPESSHLLMLEAIGGATAVRSAYEAALSAGYRWHEFGDSHLIVPDGLRR
ncbi:MAG TPA: S-adenosylmethionine:tRNA ribosyltransferase-isomerase [Acidimicrobiales bacterium]